MMRMIRYFAAISLVAVGAVAWSAPLHAQGNSLPQEMLDTTWALVAIQRSGQAPQDTTGMGITLQFNADNSAGGESTCNVYGATYHAGAGQTLTFEPVISTLRACIEQSRMDLESAYYAALESVSSYNLAGSRLQLFFDGQNSLEFVASGTTPPGMPRTGTAADDVNAGQTTQLMALAVLVLVVGLTLRLALVAKAARKRRA